jgi:hypothetical protein
MSRTISAANIRKAALHERLPVALNYRRASQVPGLRDPQRAFLRLAARFVLGSVDSAEYDIIARLQILEGATGTVSTGPNAGKWWKMGRRGLAAAAEHYAGTDIDPSWLSPDKTGLISKTVAMVTREFRAWAKGGDGMAAGPEDIIQNGLMGLSKDGMTPRKGGPIFLGWAASLANSLGKNIQSGKATPQGIAGAPAAVFLQRVKDEFKEMDRSKRRAPTTTETGESRFDLLPSQSSPVMFFDFLVTLLGSRSLEGRKLEAKMRALTGGQDLANALIDRLVERKPIGSISKLHKDLGGSGSGGSIRWIKDTFIPAVQKMVQNDRDLLSTFRLTTSRMASRRKQANLAADIFDKLIGTRDLIAVMDKVKKAGDDQSAKLIMDIRRELMGKLKIDDSTERAISRLAGLASRGKTWDPALIRNNVFKVANELGMHLPSGMFG